MQPSNYTQNSTIYDQELRSHLLSVFNYMTLALFISGLVSAYIGMSPAIAQAIWATPFKWVAMFAPIAIAIWFTVTADQLSLYASKVILFVFAVAMGVSLSSIFLVFNSNSIVQVFFITSATFGTTAIWGYTTKRELSGMGSFLMMGVFGLIIAGLVNLFLQSSMIATVVSLLGVLIFTGLTAYDMQTIKSTYYQRHGEERERAVVIGALSLYLNFVNIFISLLQLLGDRK